MRNMAVTTEATLRGKKMYIDKFKEMRDIDGHPPETPQTEFIFLFSPVGFWGYATYSVDLIANTITLGFMYPMNQPISTYWRCVLYLKHKFPARCFVLKHSRHLNQRDGPAVAILNMLFDYGLYCFRYAENAEGKVVEFDGYRRLCNLTPMSSHTRSFLLY